VAHQVQAGVGLLHYHVEQHHREVGFEFEQRARLFGRIGMHEFERPALELEGAEREGGGRVHVGVVVDDHYAPCMALPGRWRRLVHECKGVVVVRRGACGRTRCRHLLRLRIGGSALIPDQVYCNFRKTGRSSKYIAGKQH
jgi:hypothetical protein